jgi:hypothetical protein
MNFKILMVSACVVLVGCGGGDDPITIDEIVDDPGRKDVAQLCDLYVQRLTTKTDQAAEAGFKEMARMGVSEKAVKKAREAREDGREDYVEGLENCCKTFNNDVKDLNDMQTSYVYAELVLSSITADMLTPVQMRAARTLRKNSQDNMNRPQSDAAFRVRRSLPNCEKAVSNKVSRESTARIREILKE